ncbi:hypothetical protein KP509_10G073000 [Ceratopteris richardii]|uniref:Early light-induced protein n=1 Tax=Ceratopteris richardii TaxID=49495 RepID=A0A8T2U669_CERRI|nr:hypothetical protein KP509_10G073000 [Ceratopteris richardii]
MTTSYNRSSHCLLTIPSAPQGSIGVLSSRYAPLPYNTVGTLLPSTLCATFRSSRGDRHRIRARTDGDSVATSIDRETKKELRREDIERHQAETSSEERSFLGARPAANSPWPRPELERRPETGDRSLGSLFAVDGAAPETINGRMAMVGFVWALVAEKMTGLSVMEQLFHPSTSGILWFAGVVQLFTAASVIPFLNGESTDARRWGPFNAKAERWNGRLAMIGFVSLLVDEAIRQAPLLH